MPARTPMAFAILLAFLGLTAQAAPAEPAAAAPDAAEEIIQNMTLDQLVAILREAGAEEVTPSPEERIIRFKSGNRNFLVTLSACNEQGEECAVVSIGRGIRAKVPLEVLNKLNERYGGLVAASRVNEETFLLVHASVIRGGVTKTNVAVNMVWFVNEAEAFATFIKSQLVADSGGASSGSAVPVVLGELVLTPAEMARLMHDSGIGVTARPLKMKAN